jgi:hypothetical protein
MSKIEAFWKNATSDDVARVMAGETVEARFRDIETDPWCSPRDLTGCKAVGDGKLRWFTLNSFWRYCQVYREPSWYADKPDPGPGYRLLEKFPPEGLKPGDEWFEPIPFETGWKVSHNERQADTLWYRRRIEPVEPVKAISMSDFEAICNGELVKGYAYKLPNGQTITITAKGFEVTQ